MYLFILSYIASKNPDRGVDPAEKGELSHEIRPSTPSTLQYSKKQH
jgi:hypothetical protein